MDILNFFCSLPETRTSGFLNRRNGQGQSLLSLAMNTKNENAAKVLLASDVDVAGSFDSIEDLIQALLTLQSQTIYDNIARKIPEISPNALDNLQVGE
jgi:hypothetical protein